MTHVDDDYEANKRVADSLREYMGRRLNVMNAFDTPILEGLMAAVKVEPLQRIGTVLDASAKCYALRVDNTYSACYKVLSAASGETRVAPLQDENLQDDQTENEAENSNEDGGDKNRRSAANVDDREGSGDGDKQGKNKLLRPLDQSSKIKQLTQENRQLAEGLWKRFATSEQFGESEDDLWALFEQLSNDIVGTVMKRRVGAVQGSLERRDNQFSIEDAIYRKITKDFEEGSARSFVSNEVLMNDHGNFLILHTNWQGDEPFRPFPSLVNHLSAASTQCQTKAIDQMICAVNRAQTKRPSEYTLLTQICADDGQSLPTIDFHLREQCEQPIGFTADDDFDNGDDTGADQHGVIVADQNGALSLCQMEFDETITNPAFAGSAILPLTNGTTLAQGDLIDVIDETLGQQIEEEIEGGEIPNITKREGEAFGTEIAEREKQLAGGEEDICDEQIGRLIDENLLPPTQTGNENFVPLTNTLIEDASHWMGDHNLDGGLVSADQTRSKKGKAKRQLHEAGNAKATAKRRLQKRNDFEKLNGIADDMCWIPKRVVSPFVKSAIAEIQQNSLAKRRLEMEVDFSEDTPLPFLGRKLTRDRAKQLETMAYDPINLLKARVFYKSHLGVWSFFPCAVPLQRVRLIRRPHFLPPFSLPLPLNEQHNEFNKFYFEFITDSAAEENIGEENWQIDEEDGTFGDEVPVDAEFMCSPHAQSPMLDESPRRRKRDSEGTDDDELDTGFGFLNNITLSEIKQIYYQTNLNVAKVKKAMLKVLSSRKKYASVDEVEMEMADEDDDGSSCSSVNNDVELNYAEDVAGSSDDDTSSAEAGDVQGETAKSFGINSRDLFAKVPRFLSGITKRNLTVTNSFAVLLHLCNDKQFTLAQTKGTNKLVEGHSMSEFFVKF